MHSRVTHNPQTIGRWNDHAGSVPRTQPGTQPRLDIHSQPCSGQRMVDLDNHVLMRARLPYLHDPAGDRRRLVEVREA